MSEDTKPAPMIEIKVYENGEFYLIFDQNKTNELSSFLFRLTTGKYDKEILKYIYYNYPNQLVQIITSWVENSMEERKEDPAINALQMFEKLPL